MGLVELFSFLEQRDVGLVSLMGIFLNIERSDQLSVGQTPPHRYRVGAKPNDIKVIDVVDSSK